MVETHNVDWAHIICRLRSAGLNLEQQALEIGVSARTLKYWQAGDVVPSYPNGAKLLSIFETVYRST
jgi:DNA-binding transcriptional MerR regulator